MPVHSLFSRGYTGHEHLDAFNLINMNGRVYDPLLARFLSSDNVIQAPDFTQSYNRFSYCLNNPLLYTDPTGNSFIFGWLPEIVDFVSTAFFKGGLDPTSKSARNAAWMNFDPTASWSITNKDFKIDMGLFQTDPHRTLLGRVGELFSRFTWEAPQTILGNGISQVRNMFGGVHDVSYYGGVTLVNNNDNSLEEWGFTLGPYINSKNMVANPYTDATFRHEYGHTIQSELVGPFYLTSVALPSLVGELFDGWVISNHMQEWYETQADRLSYNYFSHYVPGALTALPWDDTNYPREYKPEWYWIVAHPPLLFSWWLLF